MVAQKVLDAHMFGSGSAINTIFRLVIVGVACVKPDEQTKRFDFDRIRTSNTEPKKY